MRLNALPDYLLDDNILFVELYPTALVALSQGAQKVEDKEPLIQDMVDCMLAYTKSDLKI